MGGNALKAYNTVVLDKKSAMKIGFEVITVIESLFPLSAYQSKIIESYYAKSKFGDIDILLNRDTVAQSSNWVQILVKALTNFYAKNIPFVKNGPCLSIGIPVNEQSIFQVDILTSNSLEFNFHFSYLCWNDLGNLIGRVASSKGLRFGHDGLWLPVRDVDNNNRFIRDIPVTLNFEEAIEFLGFDVSRYNQGFDYLLDIFKYVCSSKNFNRDLYKLEHCNHRQRTRDSKRKTYMTFLRWLDHNKQIPNNTELTKDKFVWLPWIFNNFPRVENEYANTFKQLSKRNEVKLKFNGVLVSEWTGTYDKELGKIMRSFKALFLTQENFFDFVLNHTQDELKETVKEVVELLHDEPDASREVMRVEFCALTSALGTDMYVASLLSKHSLLKVDSWTISNLKHPGCLSQNLKPVLLALRRVCRILNKEHGGNII